LENKSERSINTFQIQIRKEINTKVKISAAKAGLSKHDWVLSAIAEKLIKDHE
jgi:predicted HicB family RNase H-like nuclease